LDDELLEVLAGRRKARVVVSGDPRGRQADARAERGRACGSRASLPSARATGSV
jgi:hypothetical protein